MPTLWRSLRITASSSGLPLLAACAIGPGPSAGPVGLGGPPACELRQGAARGGIFEIHAPGEIQSKHGPIPTTPAERIGFRHLYETLLNVDCTGERRPGLAGSWTAEEDGRVWTFTLREGATFWDGTPLRAEDVLASWQALPAAGDGAYADALLAHARARLRLATAESAEILDARTLRIVLDRAVAEPPAWLADPALAVHSPPTENDWPPGTGSWRLHPDASLRGDSSTVANAGRLVVWPEGWTPGDLRPVLRFHPGRAHDPRELLDAGEDLLVTDDPVVLAYAETLPAMEALPLPWDRTYALLVGDPPSERDGESEERALRESLSRDAVRAEARASDVPASSRAASACESIAAPIALSTVTGLPSLPPTQGAGRVVYPRDDRTARELAERLVALAAAPQASSRPDWVTRLPRVAAGLTGDGFAEALLRRSEAAFVLPLPQESTLPCASRFQPGLSWALRPLVDARRRVIVASDVAGLAVDGDGTLLLFGAGRTGGTP